MKLKLIGSLFTLLTLTALGGQTNAPPAPDLWTLSLTSGGTTTTTGESQSTFNFDVSLGRTWTFPWVLELPLEYGLRQSVNYDSHDGGHTFWDTTGYCDVTPVRLFQDKLDPYIGLNIGINYGDMTPLWHLAPEGGVRFWFKENMGILARVDYPYDLTNGRLENVLRYFLGIEVKF